MQLVQCSTVAGMALHHGAARASSSRVSCSPVVSAVKQTHAAPILPASATCAASASGRVERCATRSLVAHCSRRSRVTRSAVATEQLLPVQLDTAPAPPQPAPVPATQHGHKEVEFVAFEDGVFTVEGRLTLAAPVGLVYGILADYDACADVFHNITSSSSQQLGPGQLQVTQASGEVGYQVHAGRSCQQVTVDFIASTVLVARAPFCCVHSATHSCRCHCAHLKPDPHVPHMHRLAGGASLHSLGTLTAHSWCSNAARRASWNSSCKIRASWWVFG